MNQKQRTANPAPDPVSAGDARQCNASFDCGQQLISSLVVEWHPAMVSMALRYVDTRDAAEEVVQATWLAVWQGLASFHGDAAFRTWVFAILIKRAHSWAQRERRLVSFADLSMAEPDNEEVNQFPRCRSDSEAPHRWLSRLRSWPSPEEELLQQEIISHVQQAIAALTANQRNIIVLHDIEGWSAEEICVGLDLSPVNQRVLLHRARARIRAIVEQYLRNAHA